MFRGYICEVSGQKVATATCLQCALHGGVDNCPLTYPLLKGIAKQQQPRRLAQGYERTVVSVTELLGCPRQWRLKQQYPHYVKPSQAYWAFRGTLAHELLAGNTPPGAFVEQRFYHPVNDEYMVTGQPDLVTQEGVLVDYKTTKSLPDTIKTYYCPECGAIMRRNQWRSRRNYRINCPHCHTPGKQYYGRDIEPVISPPEPYEHHVAQLNYYAWLLAQHDIEVQAAQVVYLDMSGVLRLEAELTSAATTEEQLKQRLLAFKRDERVKDVAADPWNCKYCAVSAVCADESACQRLSPPQHSAEPTQKRVAPTTSPTPPASAVRVFALRSAGRVAIQHVAANVAV